MEEDLKSKTNLSPKWIYLAWLGIIISSLIIVSIGAIVQGDPEAAVMKWGVVSDFATFAMSLYVVGTGVAVTVLYFYLKQKGLSCSAIGIKGNLSLSSLCYALLGTVIAYFLYLLVETVLGNYGVNMYWGSEKSTILHLKFKIDFFLIIIFAVITGPVFEESIFRGYVVTMFIERGYKPILAVLLSALVFTSVHIFFGPGAMVYIFLWSFIPSFLFLKFNTLYPSILFHVLNNLIAYIIIPLHAR